MIIKLSVALSSNCIQNLALPQPHQPPCPLSVLSDLVPGDSPLCIVYIIPQHSTLFAYSNLNGPLLQPSLGWTMLRADGCTLYCESASTSSYLIMKYYTSLIISFAKLIGIYKVWYHSLLNSLFTKTILIAFGYICKIFYYLILIN